jgi:hypothetical protein
MYSALAKVLRSTDEPDRMPEAIAVFKAEHLPKLAPSTRAEHARIYDLLSVEFADFRVSEPEATPIAHGPRRPGVTAAYCP